jgi:hypothetical protein
MADRQTDVCRAVLVLPELLCRIASTHPVETHGGSLVLGSLMQQRVSTAMDP